MELQRDEATREMLPWFNESSERRSRMLVGAAASKNTDSFEGENWLKRYIEYCRVCCHPRLSETKQPQENIGKYLEIRQRMRQQAYGMVTAKALHSAGISSFKAMEAADPRKIEIITGRKYPMGNHIKGSLSLLPPKLTMQVREAKSNKQGKSKLVLTVTRLSQPALSSKQHYADIVH